MDGDASENPRKTHGLIPHEIVQNGQPRLSFSEWLGYSVAIQNGYSECKLLTAVKPMSDLTHFDSDGNARMVDVGAKPATLRTAIATALIEMNPETLARIDKGKIEKGNVLEVARLAGIMGTKRTADLIPLCHPISVTSVDVSFDVVDSRSVEISARVQATDRTGVEMEALTAASTAALTIYDMCKSIDREMVIREIKLMHKSGGKSGTFERT